MRGILAKNTSFSDKIICPAKQCIHVILNLIQDPYIIGGLS